MLSAFVQEKGIIPGLNKVIRKGMKYAIDVMTNF